MRKIIVTVEDGNRYFTTLLTLINNNVKQTIEHYQNKVLGNPFGWYTTPSGEHKKYIKKGAYVVVDWSFA